MRGGVGSGEKEVSKLVCLLLATEEGGELRNA